nr:S26 family signal peptidase [Armatimonadota bacterium]
MRNSLGRDEPSAPGAPAKGGGPGLTHTEVKIIRDRRRYRSRRRWEWVFLTLFAAAVILFGLSFKPVRVVGHSMEPTFQ